MATATITHKPLEHPMFSQHVHTYAAKAEVAMPAASGRIARAVELVLGGCVEEIGAGRWEVASQTNFPDKWWIVRDKTCTCPDYLHRSVEDPQHLCKHVLSVFLYRRAIQALEKEETMNQEPCWTPVDEDGLPCNAVNAACPGHAAPAWQGTAAPTMGVVVAGTLPQPMLPEAPASINATVVVSGRKLMITIRDTDPDRAMEKMLALLEKYDAK